MNIQIYERKIIHIVNERIALEHCKRIVKNLLEKENMCKKNNEILISYIYEIEVEQDILCAMIPELVKLIKNKSIIVEYVIENGVKKAIITVS